MDYISVKEAAQKFQLSERRVQNLCETNRIDGCTMVSGIWLIPAMAKKPSDERLSSAPKSEDDLTLKELCEELSISTATTSLAFSHRICVIVPIPGPISRTQSSFVTPASLTIFSTTFSSIRKF